MNTKLTLTAKEAAETANVSLPTIYEWLNSEGFPALRVGRKWLIPVKAFEEWLLKQAEEKSDTIRG